MNYATLIHEKEEKESLSVTFEMMRHGVTVDLIPRTLGGEGGFFVEEE